MGLGDEEFEATGQGLLVQRRAVVRGEQVARVRLLLAGGGRFGAVRSLLSSRIAWTRR
jgi:hypothetical protein